MSLENKISTHGCLLLYSTETYYSGGLSVLKSKVMHYPTGPGPCQLKQM